MDLDLARREFRYPAGCRPRPGVIAQYQKLYEPRGEDVVAAYSFPTDDPNVHDLKIVTVRHDAQ